jgi:hypothetical protein
MNKKPTIDEKLAAAKDRGRKTLPKAETTKKPMLPIWPEEVRGVPNAVLRGAIFAVSQERLFLKEWTPIAAVDGIEIRAKGERLNQHDLDLWEQLLHLQRESPLGARVEFTAHEMLRALDRPVGGSAHVRLDNDLGRLLTSATEIRWTETRQSFAGGLVSSYFKDEDSDRYVVTFNADTMHLYAQGHTWINADKRKSLGRNLIAKWLHGFYSTHAKPYSYSVDTLWRLSGSTALRNEFRRKLRTAFEKLLATGVIDNWEIDDSDLVHVRRTPTQSQRKHMAKAKVIHKKG